MTPRTGRDLAAELACDLADVDAGPLSPAQRAAVAAFVAERLAAAPAHLRWGLEGPSLLLAAVPPRRRRAVARWLSQTRVPLLADCAKALRSLAVVRVYAGEQDVGVAAP